MFFGFSFVLSQNVDEGGSSTSGNPLLIHRRGNISIMEVIYYNYNENSSLTGLIIAEVLFHQEAV